MKRTKVGGDSTCICDPGHTSKILWLKQIFLLWKPILDADQKDVFLNAKLIKMVNTDFWTREDFLAFLTLYGANADMEISEKEKSWIKEKFGANQFQKAKQVFDTQSDYQNIQIILDLRTKFLPGEEGKTALKGFLIQLFEVDEEYSFMEKMVLKGLEKLL